MQQTAWSGKLFRFCAGRRPMGRRAAVCFAGFCVWLLLGPGASVHVTYIGLRWVLRVLIEIGDYLVGLRFITCSAPHRAFWRAPRARWDWDGWMDGGRWWFVYWASEIMSCWVLLLRERRKNHDGWPCVGSCEIWGEMSDER